MATTEAPERIWVDGSWTIWANPDLGLPKSRTEYVRADLVATPAQGDSISTVVRQHILDLRGCSSILKVSPYREALHLTIQEIDKAINELETVLTAQVSGDSISREAAEELRDKQMLNLEFLNVALNPLEKVAAIIARHCVR